MSLILKLCDYTTCLWPVLTRATNSEGIMQSGWSQPRIISTYSASFWCCNSECFHSVQPSSYNWEERIHTIVTSILDGQQHVNLRVVLVAGEWRYPTTQSGLMLVLQQHYRKNYYNMVLQGVPTETLPHRWCHLRFLLEALFVCWSVQPTLKLNSKYNTSL